MASNSGDTARLFLPHRNEFRLVLVTHAIGFAGPGKDERPAAVRAELAAAGCSLVTASICFPARNGGFRRSSSRF